MTLIIGFFIQKVNVVSVFLCGMLINSFSESYKEKIEEQVESAAYMVANQISGRDIQQIEETVKEYKGKTVTSADKEAIVRLATEIDALIASGSLSEEEMDTLRSVKSDVSEMLAKIVEEENNSDNKDNAGNNNTGNQGEAKPSDKTNGKGNGSVKTGDTNAVMPWMILLFVSGAGIIGAAEVSRKKQNK